MPYPAWKKQRQARSSSRIEDSETAAEAKEFAQPAVETVACVADPSRGGRGNGQDQCGKSAASSKFRGGSSSSKFRRVQANPKRGKPKMGFRILEKPREDELRTLRADYNDL